MKPAWPLDCLPSRIGHFVHNVQHRLPSLLSEDVELMAAYNLAAESCSHQVLFDRKQTQDWASAMATLSTTFQQLQTAQIDWNGTKRTASFHLNNMKIALDGRVQDVSVKVTLFDPSLGTHTRSKPNGICCLANSQAGWNTRMAKAGDLVPAIQSTSLSVEKGDSPGSPINPAVHTERAGLA